MVTFRRTTGFAAAASALSVNRWSANSRCSKSWRNSIATAGAAWAYGSTGSPQSLTWSWDVLA